jgi:DNA polymerase
MDETPTLDDLREELLELACSARALVGWYEGTGAWGLPAEGDADDALALLSPSRGGGGSVDRGSPERRPAPAAAPQFRPPPGPAPAPEAPPPAAAARPIAEPAVAAPRPVPAAEPPRFPADRPQPVIAPARPAARSPSSPEERMHRLVMLADEVRGCTRCRLCQARTQTVFARGNPLAELCFVGDGPGPEEDAAGEPFAGEPGDLLDKMIVAMGYHRDDVYICNIVKCRLLENHKLRPDEMEACRPHLVEQIELVGPRYIVALGSVATQGLLGTTEPITKLRGTWKMYKGTPVMPTFHPAYVKKQPSARREVWNDLQQVMARLGKKPPSKS